MSVVMCLDFAPPKISKFCRTACSSPANRTDFQLQALPLSPSQQDAIADGVERFGLGDGTIAETCSKCAETNGYDMTCTEKHAFAICRHYIDAL